MGGPPPMADWPRPPEPAAGHPLPRPAADGPGLSLAEQNRVRWRCRRGMLENDLILTKFLDARGPRISAGEVEVLDRLLALADDRLWDLLSGRAEPEEAAAGQLLAVLRSL